ncbi:MAG TPA: class I lanthipeptide [Thermoanaerobaculia bacterium]
MKKQNTVKLSLNRETLQALEKTQLEGVAGGNTALSCFTGCTCGTKYC